MFATGKLNLCFDRYGCSMHSQLFCETVKWEMVCFVFLSFWRKEKRKCYAEWIPSPWQHVLISVQVRIFAAFHPIISIFEQIQDGQRGVFMLGPVTLAHFHLLSHKLKISLYTHKHTLSHTCTLSLACLLIAKEILSARGQLQAH